MPLLKLVLSARRPPYTAEAIPARDFDAVLRRDGPACRGCGYAPGGGAAPASFLEAHRLDGGHAGHGPENGPENPENLENLENLALLCHACHGVFHVGEDPASAVIFCPWLTQAQVNLMANLCLDAIGSDPDGAREARGFMSGLHGMARLADGLFAPGASDPAALGRALADMRRQRPADYGRRGILLAGLRLLPLPGPQAFRGGGDDDDIDDI